LVNLRIIRDAKKEFAIICRRTSREDVSALIKRIKNNFNETKYHCSVGFCYCSDGTIPIEDMLKESDMMMYEEKKRFYEENNIKSR